ncbi:MAG: sigma-70 family RNA polymerase sigma factor [Bacteroidetes bacterium]|nr:sigma-70 family RNA polymerase sigma factor [Bacteroidota bacterium]
MVVNDHLSDKGKADLELVERALKNGDPRAYNALMASYRDRIFFLVYEKLNDREVAKEITIETFGKAFTKLHQYTAKYAFSTWLYTIAKNNCIDYMRKKKLPTTSIDAMLEDDEGHARNFDIISDVLNPEGELVKKQRIQILRRIVEKLKPKYRKLVKLRYFKEYTYEEIAQELDMPIGTVKAQLFRSREQLFKILSGSQEKF